MKSRFSRAVAALLSLVVFLTSFAANSLISKSLTFLEARYVPGTGIVLLFESTGLKKSDLRGATIYVHSNSYKLSCSFKDGDDKDESRIVRCVASGGLSDWAGETFTAYLAGYSFNGIIPAEKSNATATCAEGEELSVLVIILLEGEFLEGGWITADSFYAYLAPVLQQEGLDYEILNQACFPIEEEEFPEPG